MTYLICTTPPSSRNLHPFPKTDMIAVLFFNILNRDGNSWSNQIPSPSGQVTFRATISSWAGGRLVLRLRLYAFRKGKSPKSKHKKKSFIREWQITQFFSRESADWLRDKREDVSNFAEKSSSRADPLWQRRKAMLRRRIYIRLVKNNHKWLLSADFGLSSCFFSGEFVEASVFFGWMMNYLWDRITFNATVG